MSAEWLGVYRGVVASTADPTGAGRVRITVPQVLGNSPTTWATPILKRSGLQTVPSTGDQVFVAFDGGYPEKPLYWNLGSNFVSNPSSTDGSIRWNKSVGALQVHTPAGWVSISTVSDSGWQPCPTYNSTVWNVVTPFTIRKKYSTVFLKGAVTRVSASLPARTASGITALPGTDWLPQTTQEEAISAFVVSGIPAVCLIEPQSSTPVQVFTSSDMAVGDTVRVYGSYPIG